MNKGFVVLLPIELMLSKSGSNLLHFATYLLRFLLRIGYISGHGSNAGHSSGVAQGQRSLNRCSGRDFQHEVFAPTATAAFHSQTVAAGILLQQRPTRQVLSCATAKLLRDEAESMVPNIDPEQVRKLAGWGLTQNDRASFVGWRPQPSAVGPVPHQPGLLIVLRP